MYQLTSQGQQIIDDLAQRYGVSREAVMTLLQALRTGNGSMAQFNHPDLGGSGQWMAGGMTMVGDMFNYNLKATVDGLCGELSQHLANNQLLAPEPPPFQGQQQQQSSGPGSSFMGYGSTGSWWPAELGSPTASGAQNDLRYAYFAASRRLALEHHGQVTVYDTLDHQISGVSQQQGGGASITFTSQYGVVTLDSLPRITPPVTPPQRDREINSAIPEPTVTTQQPSDSDHLGSSTAGMAQSSSAIIDAIERLAQLRRQGVISEDEFTAKKKELLNRL